MQFLLPPIKIVLNSFNSKQDASGMDNFRRGINSCLGAGAEASLGV
jgi:hypothetical protein